MSLIAWLIVLQFLVVAGFIVSVAVLVVGIIVGLGRPELIAIERTDESPATASSVHKHTGGWRIADTLPETIRTTTQSERNYRAPARRVETPSQIAATSAASCGETSKGARPRRTAVRMSSEYDT